MIVQSLCMNDPFCQAVAEEPAVSPSAVFFYFESLIWYSEN